MFKRLAEAGAGVAITVDGKRVECRAGDTVAAALIAADIDGIIIVPQAVEEQVVRAAWKKAHAENEVRDAIRKGMSATKAFETFGVL